MKNCKKGLQWRVISMFILAFLANNISYGQCPTITDFDVPRGCEIAPFDSLYVESTADSIEIVAFPFGAGIDPYTTAGGTSLSVHAVPASGILNIQPYTHSLPAGFYLFYAIAHPVPADPTCRPSDVESVEIFEFVDIQTTDGTSCENSRVNLRDYISGYSNSNFISFFDNATDAMNDVNKIQEFDYPTATRDYYVTAKASNSGFIPEACISMGSFTITVLPTPTVDAGVDQTICEGEDAVLGATGGSAYSWAPSSVLSNPDIAGPTTNINTTTQFGVTVTDANGCSGTDQVTITVTQLPVCPPISGSQN